MKKGTVICLAVTLLLAAGVASAQTTFTATLDGAQANAGVGTGSTATGRANLTLNAAADALTYSITLSGLDLDGNQTPGDMTDDVIAMHFHAAATGTNGAVVFGLIGPNNDTDDLVIDPVAGTLTGIWENTDVNPLSGQLASLNDNGLYLNVHTNSFGGGEVRGQVARPAFGANLNGAQANAGVGTGSTATGRANLTLNAAADALTYSITLTGLDLDGNQTPGDATDDVIAMHFHAAAAGTNGGIVFGLIGPNDDTDDLVIDPVAGTLTGIWENTDVNPLSGQYTNLNADGLYLNVHTVSFGGGEIRGQVKAAILTDGFESGNTAAWSATVP